MAKINVQMTVPVGGKMEIDLANLKALAKKIVSPVWEYEKSNENLINGNSERFGVVLPEYGEYIAAANPQTILKLIAEIERLEKELQAAKGELEIWRPERPCPMCENNTFIVHRTYAPSVSGDNYWIMACENCDWQIFADTREELIAGYEEASDA